jgi:glutamine synthetase
VRCASFPGSEKSQRVEYRIAAADMNPYWPWRSRSARASTHREQIEPMPAIVGNSYDMKHPAEARPAAHAVGSGAAPAQVEGGGRPVR